MNKKISSIGETAKKMLLLFMILCWWFVIILWINLRVRS